MKVNDSQVFNSSWHLNQTRPKITRLEGAGRFNYMPCTFLIPHTFSMSALRSESQEAHSMAVMTAYIFPLYMCTFWYRGLNLCIILTLWSIDRKLESRREIQKCRQRDERRSGGGEGLAGGKMDCEVCIMQVSGHSSVSCAPHNRWQTHWWWVPAW